MPDSLVEFVTSTEAITLTAGGPGSGRYPKGSGKNPRAGSSTAPSAGAKHIGPDGRLDRFNMEDYFHDRYGFDGGELDTEAAARAREAAASEIADRMRAVPVEEFVEYDDQVGTLRTAEAYRESLDGLAETGEYYLYYMNEQVFSSPEWVDVPSAVDPEGDCHRVDSPEGEQLVRRAVAGDLLRRWAETSADSDSRAWAMQRAVGEKFGVDLPESSKPNSYVTEEADKIFSDHSSLLTGFADAQASATRAQLKADGITTIEVFRGMTLDADATPEFEDDVTVQLNPASSWSVDKATAKGFANPRRGVVLSTEVGVDQVLGMAGTGFGTLLESEIVVIGGTMEATAERTSVSEAPRTSLTSSASQVLNPDADGGDDWIKTVGWDLSTDPADFTEEELGRLRELPAWESAPDSLKSQNLTAGGPGSGRYPKGSGKRPRAGREVQPSGGAKWIDRDGSLSPWNADNYWYGRYDYAVPSDRRIQLDRAAKAKKLAVQNVADRMTDVPIDDLVVLHTPGGEVYKEARDEGLRVKLDELSGKLTRYDTSESDPVAGTPEADELARKAIVGDLIRQWSVTAADHDATSWAMQRAAAEEFGFDMRPSHAYAEVSYEVDEFWEERSSGYRSFVRAQKEATQAQLKADGVTEVELYRGMIVPVPSPEAGFIGSEGMTMDSNPLSSWTVQAEVADQFASHHVGMERGIVLHTRVPAEQIFSMPGTGFGCLEEFEVVMVGPTVFTEVGDESQMPFRSTSPVRVNVDSGDNADWIKTLTWDFPLGVSEEEVEVLRKLPAWKAAPEHLRNATVASAVTSLVGGGPGSGRYPKGSGKRPRAGRKRPRAGRTRTPSPGAAVITDGKLNDANAGRYWEARYPWNRDDPLQQPGTAKRAASIAVAEEMSDVPMSEITELDELFGGDGEAQRQRAQELGRQIGTGKFGDLVVKSKFDRDPLPDQCDPYSPEGDKLMRQYVASRMIRQWAYSAGDHSPVSLAIQKAAAEEFGVPFDVPGADGAFEDRPEVLEHVPAFRSFVRAQSAATQAQFRADGIAEVEVFRGMRSEVTESGTVQLRPLSSFTTSYGTAESFANGYAGSSAEQSTGKPIVLSATIPVDRIVAAPGTGSGCLDEKEIIIKGGDLESTVQTFASGSVRPDDGGGDDWIKTVAWDLPTDPEAFTREELEALAELPAWAKAPDQIKAALAQNLTAGGPGSGRYPKGSGKRPRAGTVLTEADLERYSGELTTPRLRARASKQIAATLTDFSAEECASLAETFAFGSDAPDYAEGQKVRLEESSGLLKVLEDGDLYGETHYEWVDVGTPEADQMIREDAVTRVLTHWSVTAGDASANAWAIQRAAAELHPEGDEWLAESRKDVPKYVTDTADSVFDSHRDLLVGIAAAQRDQVRERLNADGITAVEVYRGVRVPVGEEADFDAALADGTLALRPLSSFSVSPQIARNFAAISTPGYTARVIKATVPVDAIASMAPFGMGSKTEREVIVSVPTLRGESVAVTASAAPSYDIEADGNDDWIKVLSWDLPDGGYSPEQLDELSRLPVWKSAPASLTAAASPEESPGQALAERAEMEATLLREMLEPYQEFIDSVIDDATRQPTTALTAGLTLTLGSVMRRWSEFTKKLTDKIAQVFGMGEEDAAKVAERISASTAVDQTFEAVQETFQITEADADVAAIRERMRETMTAKMPESVAERLIRTEATSAYNYRQLRRIRTPYKKWVAHHDDRTRGTHKIADGQVVAVGDTFKVGNDRLMFPAEPVGSPGEIVNCRCVIVGTDTAPGLSLTAGGPGSGRYPKGSGKRPQAHLRNPKGGLRPLRKGHAPSQEEIDATVRRLQEKGLNISNSVSVLVAAGMNEPPTVLPSEEFDAVPGTPYWRGVAASYDEKWEPEGIKPDQLYDRIVGDQADESYVGSGIHANGTHLGTSRIAAEYLGKDKSRVGEAQPDTPEHSTIKSNSVMLQVKVHPDARIINDVDLPEEVRQKSSPEITRWLVDNGYDGINTSQSYRDQNPPYTSDPSNEVLVIINRAAMIIEQPGSTE